MSVGYLATELVVVVSGNSDWDACVNVCGVVLEAPDLIACLLFAIVRPTGQLECRNPG